MKYSRILDHVDSSDMRNTHAKKLAAKKIQEDKIIADKEYIRNVMNNIKSDWKKELDESIANSTTGVLGARVIQSAGDADLEVVQTGLTGDGGIDYGADGYALNSQTGNSTHTGDGEYTGITAWEPTDTAPDPTGVGTRFRPIDYAGVLHSSMELFMKNLPGYKGGVGGTQLDIGKNYVVSGVGPYGHINNAEYGKYGNVYGHTVDELGKTYPTSGDHGHGTSVIFKMGLHWAPLKPVDTSEFDTIKFRARVNANNIQSPNDAVQLYYWAGDKPGFQSLADILPNQTVPHDGWRPLYQKPDGSIDNSVSHIIIPWWQDRPNNLENSNKLVDYSQKIPEWCRGKDTRFIIYGTGSVNNSWAMTSVRFQRRNNITVGTPLDSPEASSFVRVGQGSADTTPEQRKKKIEDMLKASRLYLMKVLGYADFPGMSATLDSIAASPVGFHKIYDTHAATLSPEDRSKFRNALSDRSRGKYKGNKNYGNYHPTNQDSKYLKNIKKGGTKRADWHNWAIKGMNMNSSYEYENKKLLDLKEKASRLINKPVKTNKLFGHIGVSDMRKSQKNFDYEGKPSPDGFPENDPPKLDPKTGMHPEYGKNAKRYKKLDPISARSMPKTGDPETDAEVAKAARQPK